MWEISAVKARGREAFKANYWPSVIVSLILSMFVGSGAAATSQQTSSTDSLIETGTITQEEAAAILVALGISVLVISVVSILIKMFLTNPIEVGCARFFKKNVERSGATVGTIGEGFGGYGRVFVTLLLRDLFIVLWSLLLVVPGIMKAYSYRLVPYIVKDEPELSASEVLKRSEQIMRGNRWKSFVLDLSFIGWICFGVITLGIGFVFWTTPYINSTDAALYLELTGK